MFGLGFNEDGAAELLKEFKETAEFAGLYQPRDDVDNADAVGDKGAAEQNPPRVAIGDKVQCAINGSEVFAAPATVLGFSEDGKWVFTDQSDAGAPLEGVTVIEVAQSPNRETPSAGATPPPIPAHLRKMREKVEEREAPAGVREDKASLDEGEVVLWWPEELSADSVADFEYWVKGIIRRAKRRAGIEASAEDQ